MSQRTSLMKPASVLLGAFLCGYLSAHGRIGPPAGAAPADVHGSVGVAVTGFQTSAGSYVLWSDGDIAFGPPTVSSSVVVNFNPPFTDTPLVLGILAGGGGYASSVLSAGTIPQNVVPLVSTTSSATLSSTAPMYAATSPPFAWVIAIGN